MYGDLAAQEYLALPHQVLPEDVPYLYIPVFDVQGIHTHLMLKCGA